MRTVYHDIPVGDLLQHEESDECACLPVTKPTRTFGERAGPDDGMLCWFVSHNAWVGRGNPLGMDGRG